MQQRKMTEKAYRQKMKRLETAVSDAKLRLQLPGMLSEKLVRKTAVRAAEEALRQHKLNYFELVDTTLRQ